MTAPDDIVAIRPSAVRRWLWPVLLPLLAAGLLFGAAALWQRQRFHGHDVVLLACFLLGALALAVQCGCAARVSWQLPAVTLTLAPAGLTLEYRPGRGTIPWRNVDAFGLVRDDWLGQTAGLRLRSYDGVPADLVPTLEELRRTRGYDVQVPRRVLDCSVDEFCGLLDAYLERYGWSV